MKWTSIVAIYFLFWCFSYFLVLPFRLRPDGYKDAPDVHVPGQVEGAPSFSFVRTAKWTTFVAILLTALYCLNYINGWLTPEMIDFVKLA